MPKTTAQVITLCLLGVLGKFFSKSDDNSTPMANDILAQRNRTPTVPYHPALYGTDWMKHFISHLLHLSRYSFHPPNKGLVRDD